MHNILDGVRGVIDNTHGDEFMIPETPGTLDVTVRSFDVAVAVDVTSDSIGETQITFHTDRIPAITLTLPPTSAEQFIAVLERVALFRLSWDSQAQRLHIEGLYADA